MVLATPSIWAIVAINVVGSLLLGIVTAEAAAYVIGSVVLGIAFAALGCYVTRNLA